MHGRLAGRDFFAPMVLAVTADLLFRAKLEAAARAAQVPLTVVPDDARAVALLASQPATLVLLDLDQGGEPAPRVHALRSAAPKARLIGYGAHVQAARLAAAHAAGCDRVLPRSAFARQLAALLRDHV